MRVFVAGASGAIGRRLLPLLVQRGHDVTGMTRTAGKADSIRALGAEPVVCDVYDSAELMRVVAGSTSDAVVHLLTNLPTRFTPRGNTASTDRLRREGTRNLLRATHSAGIGRLVAESIAFQYRPDGPQPKAEQDPPWLDAPRPLADTLRAVTDLERQVLEEPSLEGIVLRFGWLYGPGTWYAPDGSIARDVRRRMYPIVGAGTGVWSFIHVDDAASAVVAALEAAPAGVYNVVDDEPAPLRDWLPAFADAIGAPRPLTVPGWVARLIAGRAAVDASSRLAGASNAKARALRWSPDYPTWRTGFRAI